MASKNYTTIVPANRNIAERQDALVKHGATGLYGKYEFTTDDAKGRTLYKHMQTEPRCLLGPGEEEDETRNPV